MQMYLRFSLFIIVFSVIGEYNYEGCCNFQSSDIINPHFATNIEELSGTPKEVQQFKTEGKSIIKGKVKFASSSIIKRIIGYIPKKDNEDQNNKNENKTNPIDRVEHIYIKNANDGIWR